MFQIILEKLTEGKEYFDAKVSSTIIEIVKFFFLDFENTIIYFCSSTENKELKRFIAFNRWYERTAENIVIEKFDNVISFDGDNYYTSLLIHKNNERKEDFLKVFVNLESYLDIEKL